MNDSEARAYPFEKFFIYLCVYLSSVVLILLRGGSGKKNKIKKI